MKFITSNKNKLLEARDLLNIELEQISSPLQEIQSTDTVQVIKFKIKDIKYKEPVIAEDTGLFLGKDKEIGALIKWIPSKRIVKAYLGERAIAVCTIGLKMNKEIHYFNGRIDGKIVKPRGKNGFGWDPIFQPKGYRKTFAEMSMREKSKISHRKKAFDKLKSYLNS